MAGTMPPDRRPAYPFHGAMKITTLIPAYKTKYLAELLTGLLTQTRPSERVIVSDDSPDGSFGALLRDGPMARFAARLPLEIHPGPRAGAYENFKHLVKLWGGQTELFHIHLDDDVIYPDFYAQHRLAHATGDPISCSVSARWTANEKGQPIEGMPIPESIFHAQARMMSVGPMALISSTVPYCQNWLGEFSNCVIRAEHAGLLADTQFAGVSYAGLWDLGFFIAATLRQPVAYIQDRLGYFRAGGEGHSAQVNGKHMKAAHLGYAALGVGLKRLGRLNEAQAKLCYEGIASALMARYSSQDDMKPFAAVLMRMARQDPAAQDEFVTAWHAFLKLHGF